jgi:chromate reductase
VTAAVGHRTETLGVVANMDERRNILLISGSLRRASTNTALLETARAIAPRSLILDAFPGIADLPHFNPDDDTPPRDFAVEHFRAAIRAADAVLFSTPEYAGSLPGSFKNALDWAVGDDQTGSLNEKPVAWINAALRGAANAHAALRTVLGYLGARIVEEACVHIPVGNDAIGPDGLINSADIRSALADALGQLAAAI